MQFQEIHCTWWRVSTHLTQFREVVLLTEGALPQPCLIVPDCLVVALTLWTPVSNASDIADDELSWKSRDRKGQAERIEGRALSHHLSWQNIRLNISLLITFPSWRYTFPQLDGKGQWGALEWPIKSPKQVRSVTVYCFFKVPLVFPTCSTNLPHSIGITFWVPQPILL